jgi:hypothetical protein
MIEAIKDIFLVLFNRRAIYCDLCKEKHGWLDNCDRKALHSAPFRD